MKITGIFKNTIAKILYNTPSAKLERKIDNFIMVMNRNKIIAPAPESIDNIISFTKKLGVKHDIYI